MASSRSWRFPISIDDMYPEYIAALNLTPETADHVELLGRGNGRRQTDRIETVLAPEHDPATGRYVTRFLVRGVRHMPTAAEEAIRSLHKGDILTPLVEPTNPSDRRARLIMTGDTAIGYVPSYLLSDLDTLDASNAGPTFVVERVNLPPHPAHHRVLVRLEASWPEGFEPFDEERFRPYCPEITDGAIEPSSQPAA